MAAYLFKEAGIDLFNRFDYYAGTSVGSINLMSLLSKKDPELLCKFYDKHMSKIFKKSFFRLPASANRYDDDALEEGLKDAISGKFSDLGKPMFAASHNLSLKQRKIWWSEGEDGKIDAWKIARSSAAAHTYFPPYKNMDGFWHADGGVFANDPSLPLLCRIVGSYGVPIEELKIFVVGTGFSKADNKERTGLPPKTMLGWLPIFKSDTVTNVIDTRDDARNLLGGDKYYLADFDLGDDDVAIDDIEACKKLPGKCMDQIKEHAEVMRKFFG